MKRGLRNTTTLVITTLVIIRNGRPAKSKTSAAAHLELLEEAPIILLDQFLGNSLVVVGAILAEATEQEHRPVTQLQHLLEEELPTAWMFLHRRAVSPGT